MAACRTPGTSADQVVELAVLNSLDERGDLRWRVDQRRTTGMARIADGDRPTGQFGHLHAAAVRVAVAALTPPGSPQSRSWHAVVGLSHRPSHPFQHGRRPAPASRDRVTTGPAGYVLVTISDTLSQGLADVATGVTGCRLRLPEP